VAVAGKCSSTRSAPCSTTTAKSRRSAASGGDAKAASGAVGSASVLGSVLLMSVAVSSVDVERRRLQAEGMATAAAAALSGESDGDGADRRAVAHRWPYAVGTGPSCAKSSAYRDAPRRGGAAAAPAPASSVAPVGLSGVSSSGAVGGSAASGDVKPDAGAARGPCSVAQRVERLSRSANARRLESVADRWSTGSLAGGGGDATSGEGCSLLCTRRANDQRAERDRVPPPVGPAASAGGGGDMGCASALPSPTDSRLDASEGDVAPPVAAASMATGIRGDDPALCRPGRAGGGGTVSRPPASLRVAAAATDSDDGAVTTGSGGAAAGTDEGVRDAGRRLKNANDLDRCRGRSLPSSPGDDTDESDAAGGGGDMPVVGDGGPSLRKSARATACAV